MWEVNWDRTLFNFVFVLVDVCQIWAKSASYFISFHFHIQWILENKLTTIIMIIVVVLIMIIIIVVIIMIIIMIVIIVIIVIIIVIILMIKIIMIIIINKMIMIMMTVMIVIIIILKTDIHFQCHNNIKNKHLCPMS